MDDASLQLDEYIQTVESEAAPILPRIASVILDLVPLTVSALMMLSVDSPVPLALGALWFLLRDYEPLSFGNKIMRLEVLRMNGRGATPLQSLVRNLVHTVANNTRRVAALSLAVGYEQFETLYPAAALLCAIFAIGLAIADLYLALETPTRRLVGDYLAGTFVRLRRRA